MRHSYAQLNLNTTDNLIVYKLIKDVFLNQTFKDYISLKYCSRGLHKLWQCATKIIAYFTDTPINKPNLFQWLKILKPKITEKMTIASLAKLINILSRKKKATIL